MLEIALGRRQTLAIGASLDQYVPVSSIMKENPITVSPETETLTAIEIMRENGIGCLPVTKDGRLVGVVTERDFMVITRELLVQKLKE